MSSRLDALVADLQEVYDVLATQLTTLQLTLDVAGTNGQGFALLTPGEIAGLEHCATSGRDALKIYRDALVQLKDAFANPRGSGTKELIERLTREI